MTSCTWSGHHLPLLCFKSSRFASTLVLVNPSTITVHHKSIPASRPLSCSPLENLHRCFSFCIQAVFLRVLKTTSFATLYERTSTLCPSLCRFFFPLYYSLLLEIGSYVHLPSCFSWYSDSIQYEEGELDWPKVYEGAKCFVREIREMAKNKICQNTIWWNPD